MRDSSGLAAELKAAQKRLHDVEKAIGRLASAISPAVSAIGRKIAVGKRRAALTRRKFDHWSASRRRQVAGNRARADLH
jgi:hypothetical protein